MILVFKHLILWTVFGVVSGDLYKGDKIGIPSRTHDVHHFFKPEDERDASRNGYGEKSNLDLSNLLSEALSKSKIVQEHSRVFIQLGKYLVENSTNISRKNKALRLKHDHQSNEEPEKTPRTGEEPPEKMPPIPRNAKIMPGYAAWPLLRVFPGNTSISNQMKPPGFLKRAGIDFKLDRNIVLKLKYHIVRIGAGHKPNDRRDWDTMNFYSHDQKLNARRRWHDGISRHDLYPADDPRMIDSIMDSLALGEITEVEDTGDAGTQIKFIMWIDNDFRAMVKPIRFSREQESLPNHYYFSDHERHVAEIAAFHLDRLLNFRRVPPVTGRLLNMTSEIYEPGEALIKEEFFISPAGNLCYRGNCDYYCDVHHLTCGRPDLLEVSMMAFLPSRTRAKRSSWEHPWRKSYSPSRRAAWEGDDRYCDDVRQRPFYRQGRSFLDLMDLAVFDFLTGNTDRHHFNTFRRWDNNTAMVIVDNGKGFGNSKEDEMVLLLPISQCCAIRFTTLRTLYNFHNAPVSLGKAMRRSMSRDALAPVLLDAHLKALDRRVKIILKTIAGCLETKSAKEVIIDDGF